jgi:DNA-binding beta-propeller fold protein YncE
MTLKRWLATRFGFSLRSSSGFKLAKQPSWKEVQVKRLLRATRSIGKAPFLVPSLVQPGMVGLAAAAILAWAASSAQAGFIVGDLLVPDRGAGAADNSVLRYDGTTGVFKSAFVPDHAGGLHGPTGLAFGADGNVYIASSGNNIIPRYDNAGNFVSVFADDKAIQGPNAIAFGADGNLYVANNNSLNIVRFNGKTGKLIDTFIKSGSGGLETPLGMTFGPDGNLYVSDVTSVLRYNGKNGQFIDQFVKPGSGGLEGARGLAFGPGGLLYVVSNDPSTHDGRVLRYSAKGTFLDTFTQDGHLFFSSNLTFGSDGNLYVSSTGGFLFGKVSRFNGTTGQFMDDFVMPGSGGLSDPPSLEFLPNVTVKNRLTNLPLLPKGLLQFARVGFDDVLVPGTASALSLSTMDLLPPKSDLKLFGAADLFTNAIFDGRVDVAFQYDPALLPKGFDERDLRLIHFQGGAGTTPTDVTTGADVADHLIFGNTDSLSAFAIGSAPVPEPSSLVLCGLGTVGWILCGTKLWRRQGNTKGVEKAL